MTRRLLAMTLGAALAAFGSLPSPASADDAQVARGRTVNVSAVLPPAVYNTLPASQK